MNSNQTYLMDIDSLKGQFVVEVYMSVHVDLWMDDGLVQKQLMVLPREKIGIGDNEAALTRKFKLYNV